MARMNKRIRQELLAEKISTHPFLRDEELAMEFGVSVQTIRLDRMELGIPELRERTKLMAQRAQNNLRAIAEDDVVGELVDLEVGRTAISVLKVTEDMVLAKTKIARGHYIFYRNL